MVWRSSTRFWSGSSDLGAGSESSPIGPRQAWNLDDRPDLDRTPTGGGDLLGDADRLIQVGRFDQVIPAQLLTGFRKRTIRDQAFAFADADACGGGGRVQRRGRDVLPLR